MERRNGLAFATLSVVAMGGLAATLHGNARTAVLVILVIAAVFGGTWVQRGLSESRQPRSDGNQVDDCHNHADDAE